MITKLSLLAALWTSLIVMPLPAAEPMKISKLTTLSGKEKWTPKIGPGAKL